MINGTSPLLVGPPIDFAAASRRYIKARTKQYSAQDVDYIVSAYLDVCQSGQVDAEFCLTQMIHETGALTSEWSGPTKRNPAGIGVTGVPGAGLIFETWADAVEAHVGLILCYRFPAGQGDPEQQVLINDFLRLRPGAPRGVSTTVAELAAKWAADPEYVNKLATINAAVSAA